MTSFVLDNGDANLCVCGDFNSVRSSEERKSCGSVFRQHDADILKKFIENSFLVDFRFVVNCSLSIVEMVI